MELVFSKFFFVLFFSCSGKMASGIGEEKYPGLVDSDGGALAGGQAPSPPTTGH